MHSGKRNLPYTNSYFPAKPSEFLSPSSYAPSWGEKKQPQKDKRKPLSLSSRGGDEPAGTQNTLAQTNTLLQKAVLDVMLPYAFAVMMDVSQTLPAERCRLWLKESIFYSHNQMLPVVLPAETDWRAWVGYSHNRLNTVPFPSVTWKFSLQYDNEADCFIATKLHSLKAS